MSTSEVLRTIDGPIAPLPCLSRRAHKRCEDCADEVTCRIRKMFAEVFWSYLLIIDSLTLADMLRQVERPERRRVPETTIPLIAQISGVT